MKKLTDEGKIERLCNGIYYLPYVSILGTKGPVSIKQIIDKKFIKKNEKTIGFYTGLSLINKLGFTTQNAAVY